MCYLLKEDVVNVNLLLVKMEFKKAVSALKEVLNKEGLIRVITHFDTDGLMSGVIISKTLKRENQRFWITSVKQLETFQIKEIEKQSIVQKWKALFFLDLGSGNLSDIINIAKKCPECNVFVLDHHEIEKDFDLKELEKLGNFFLVNPMIGEKERLSGSGVCYLFSKEFNIINKDLSIFGALGIIGDLMEKDKDKTSSSIFEEAKEYGMQIKKGLTLFAGTRPVHKALEYSSSVFIPGVTGSNIGALNLLKEIGVEIKTSDGKYRTMLELDDDEMSKLITAILLRRIGEGHSQDILGNIYLVKFYGQLYDARELSAMINACGRLDQGALAFEFTLGSKKAKEEVELVYLKYKQHLVKSLNWVYANKNIQGDNYVIVNAKDSIKDTLIGTVTSILASSSIYPKGTILLGLAYREDDKIKVSARLSGVYGNNEGNFNLSHVLRNATSELGGEVGGHANAAGCLIEKSKENFFINSFQNVMSIEKVLPAS